MQNGHLHHQSIEGLALYDRARPVQNLVGHRDVAAHRQTVHELGIGGASGKAALPHAPIGELGAQARIGLGVAVVGCLAPFLGVHDVCAGEA